MRIVIRSIDEQNMFAHIAGLFVRYVMAAIPSTS